LLLGFSSSSSSFPVSSSFSSPFCGVWVDVSSFARGAFLSRVFAFFSSYRARWGSW